MDFFLYSPSLSGTCCSQRPWHPGLCNLRRTLCGPKFFRSHGLYENEGKVVALFHFRDACQRRRDEFPSSISTRVRISKGTRRCLAKTRIRKIAGTSTKALTWVGKNLARVPFGRRWRTVLWPAKISGLMTPSSLVSDKRFSNTSKFVCS